jgi:glutaredoxin
VRELILYGRQGCHLCEDMQAAMEEFRSAYGFRLRVVDIDGDPHLAARYGALVPALFLDDEEICHYFLDPAALVQALTGAEAIR